MRAVPTHDACCRAQRAADALEEWVRADDWTRLAAEKRAVLGCMAQVRCPATAGAALKHACTVACKPLMLRSGAWVWPVYRDGQRAGQRCCACAQVLDSCHQLMASAGVAVEGIARLLQHMLRCVGGSGQPAAPPVVDVLRCTAA